MHGHLSDRTVHVDVKDNLVSKHATPLVGCGAKQSALVFESGGSFSQNLNFSGFM